MTPEQALIHYPLSSWKKITPISVGLIHATYKVTAPGDGGTFILQRLHPMLSHPSLTADYDAVTAHLAARGLVSQRVVRTSGGELTVPDEDVAERSWRLLTFVPGVCVEMMSGAGVARACGAAAGAFHASLADMKYKFQSRLKFHPYDYDKFYRDFRRVVKKFARDPLMAGDGVADDVDFLLKLIPKLSLPAGLPKRVVHGDLKISNFIFAEDGSHVRAIIDLDTCARCSVLLELGDAMRSWCGRAEDDAHNVFNMAIYRAAVTGYEKGAPGFLSTSEKRLLPRAVKLIIATQALRFLKDYFEDFYFGWNQKAYSSRRGANLARARGQLALLRDAMIKLK